MVMFFLILALVFVVLLVIITQYRHRAPVQGVCR